MFNCWGKKLRKLKNKQTKNPKAWGWNSMRACFAYIGSEFKPQPWEKGGGRRGN